MGFVAQDGVGVEPGSRSVSGAGESPQRRGSERSHGDAAGRGRWRWPVAPIAPPGRVGSTSSAPATTASGVPISVRQRGGWRTSSGPAVMFGSCGHSARKDGRRRDPTAHRGRHRQTPFPLVCAGALEASSRPETTGFVVVSVGESRLVSGSRGTICMWRDRSCIRFPHRATIVLDFENLPSCARLS